MMKTFMITRSISKSAAVFAALVINYYFAMSEPFWMPITTILVMQTAVGISLRQGVQRFIVIAVAMCVGTLFVVGIPWKFVQAMLIVIIFSACCYYSEKNSLAKFSVAMPSLFGVVILIALLFPAQSTQVIYSRLYDITIGAVIGNVVNLLIFPERADVEFRNNIVPVLHAYSQYLTAIFRLLYRKKHAEKTADAKKYYVEKKLQTQTAFFPEWVYESGFNIVMRQGHRHFLVMIERVGQILFSMHFVARHSFDPLLLQELHQPLLTCVEQINHLIQALTTVLNLKKLKATVSDLSEEVVELEKIIKKILPPSLELLDTSKDYIYLVALVQDIKDLRVVLVNLAQSLHP